MNGFRSVLGELYDSTCTISGSKEKVKDPITRETKLITKIKYKDIKCKISKQSLSKNNQTDIVNQIVYELKLFISPMLEIHQGDNIEVTDKFGNKTIYKAGEGFKYTSHQEVILSKTDRA